MLAVMTASGSEAKSKFSLSSEQNSPDRWDVPAVTSRDGEESMETQFRRNETEVGLVKELFSEKEIATSAVNISTSGLGKEEVVVSAPINFKMQVDSIVLAPSQDNDREVQKNANLHAQAAMGSDQYLRSAMKETHPQTTAVKDNEKGRAAWGLWVQLLRWKS
nr:hypothetical protein CFP56_61449 [Quercus suber]